MKMRNLLIVLLFAIGCLAHAQTPEATVQKFADLITKKDVDGAAALVKNGKITPEMKKQMLQGGQWPTFTLSKMSSKVDGQSAKVSYTLHATGIGEVPDHEETLDLTNTSTGWLILPPKDMGTNTNSAILPTVAFFFGNPQAIEQSRESAKSTACMSNLKQLALATIMYTTDFDDVLPVAAKWKTSIYPYCKNDALFTCPEDAKGAVSYSLNSYVSKVKMSKVKQPASTVLAYEGTAGKLNFRHLGRAAVAFCDGHVKLLTQEQAKSLVWKP